MAHSQAFEDEKINTLYEASFRGCVSTLSSIIQQDPLILNKLSLTTFTDTPLHISTLLGHLPFTDALLTHKRQLAEEVDSTRRTPLHLASAEGHKEIVQTLLQAYEDACLKPDQDGRIPLHYAAMRGRTEVVRELIRGKPESLRLLDRGKTLLHLCVEHNHLDTLKALVEEKSDQINELLNFGDSNGNTILHLAVMLKQIETVSYLLSIPKIREEANSENNMRFTAFDMLEFNQKDFTSLEIQLRLMDSGIKREKSQTRHPPPSAAIDIFLHKVRPPKVTCWSNIRKWMGYLLKHNPENWLEEMRGTLSLVTTVISTITFQVAINPPGGVMSTDSGTVHECIKIGGDDGENELCLGESVFASRWAGAYCRFIIFNTISFVASLSVTLLLVSGVPLRHKVIIWILSIGMCIALTCLALTYLSAILFLTPYAAWDQTEKLYLISLLVWVSMLGLVGVFSSMRFLHWLVRKCVKKVKRTMSTAPR